VQAHPFFAGIDFAALMARRIPSFVPQLRGEVGDVRYFDDQARSARGGEGERGASGAERAPEDLALPPAAVHGPAPHCPHGRRQGGVPGGGEAPAKGAGGSGGGGPAPGAARADAAAAAPSSAARSPSRGASSTASPTSRPP